MAKFQGFKTFEVYSDNDSLFVEQMSREFGKTVVVEIPISLWKEFISAAEFEIEQAAE